MTCVSYIAFGCCNCEVDDGTICGMYKHCNMNVESRKEHEPKGAVRLSGREK